MAITPTDRKTYASLTSKKTLTEAEQVSLAAMRFRMATETGQTRLVGPNDIPQDHAM